MSELSDEDRASIKSAVSKLLATGLSGEDANTEKTIADEIEFAKTKVDQGQWSENRAQQHVRFAVRAAASIYASQKKLGQIRTKAAMLELINTIGASINSIVGFGLLPIPTKKK